MEIVNKQCIRCELVLVRHIYIKRKKYCKGKGFYRQKNNCYLGYDLLINLMRNSIIIQESLFVILLLLWFIAQQMLSLFGVLFIVYYICSYYCAFASVDSKLRYQVGVWTLNCFMKQIIHLCRTHTVHLNLFCSIAHMLAVQAKNRTLVVIISPLGRFSV